MQTPEIDVIAISDRGLVREINEDAVRVVPEVGLLILADGMGGYNAGEVASRLAVDLVADQLTPILQQVTTGIGLRSKVQQVVDQANEAILRGATQMGALEGMGTTLVIVVIGAGFLFHAHIGDSRLYRFRDGKLCQLTQDHTMLQDMVSQGVFTSVAEAREAGVPGNVLTRALGTSKVPKLSSAIAVQEEGDLYLLCSDGLTDMLSDEEILAQLEVGSKDLDWLGKQLMTLACAAGGRDNISIILARPVSSA